ncbi:MAG: xanthine dehydrogenase family protein subunit M [Desulfobacterales bacterium]|nr:xanthine dehydrogenase family protein subunit M [Desulfobacterales bacterium]MDX2511155.1 xanthine dehydrogenase family protein subunit M [Desulfobacterales bacterium]
MLLPKFKFHEPKTEEEACQILTEYGEKAKPIAGGTDLVVNMKKKLLSPEHVVSLSRIGSLKGLEKENGFVKIGACFTVADMIEAKDIKENVSALSASAGALGSPLVRNLATVGGNIGSARPAADLPPSLMAYGATLILKSSHGERNVGIDNFFKGPGATACGVDEFISEIQVQTPPAGAGAGYLNLGARKAQDCNIVNVASFIALDGSGVIETARVILGCVGPIQVRARAAEKILVGEKPAQTLFEKAAEATKTDCLPITDFRGSGGYKLAMVGVLTQRTLKIALGEAKKNT